MYLVYYAYTKTASYVSVVTTVNNFNLILLDIVVYPY
jgi:hypothetical protein